MRIALGEKADPCSPAVLAELQAQVIQLERQQTQAIEADLQHLRELAALTRTADTLGTRRNSRQILLDVLAEASRVIGSDRVWVIEPDAHGRPRSVYGRPTADIEFDDLPIEARNLFDRIMRDRAAPIQRMPHYATDGPSYYIGLPIVTVKYIMGVLVFDCKQSERCDATHTLRLLRSILRQAAVACENARLIESMSQMTVRVVAAMAMAVESRDPYTGGHTRRVTAYSIRLGQELGLSVQELSVLRLGGLLHDIGKVTVPDAILRKPGRLTPEEFEIMKTHSEVGYEIVRRIPQLANLQGIVRHHHERYDGKGYPCGLAGNDIPYLARIVAVADTFDAMTSDRSYRPGLAYDVAINEIKACSGTQFDPEIAEAFVSLPQEELVQVARQRLNWSGLHDQAPIFDFAEMLDLNLPVHSA